MRNGEQQLDEMFQFRSVRFALLSAAQSPRVAQRGGCALIHPTHPVCVRREWVRSRCVRTCTGHA